MSKKEFCVLTFHSTHIALKFEKVAKTQNIDAKLIPVPRQVSSSCGLAARFDCDDREKIKDICTAENIELEEIFLINSQGEAKIVS